MEIMEGGTLIQSQFDGASLELQVARIKKNDPRMVTFLGPCSVGPTTAATWPRILTSVARVPYS